MKILIIRILSNGTIIFLLCSSSVAIYVAVENVEKDGTYNFKAALQEGISGVWSFILSFQVMYCSILCDLWYDKTELMYTKYLFILWYVCISSAIKIYEICKLPEIPY